MSRGSRTAAGLVALLLGGPSPALGVEPPPAVQAPGPPAPLAPDPSVPAMGVPPVIPIPANCAPNALVRIVLRNITPGLQAASPSAQPRTIYRFGTQYMRLEEPLDPMRGRQMVTIVSEPDIWTINLADRTARHAVDQDPILQVRAPVVGGPGVPQALWRFEFGCEMDYLAVHAPRPVRQLEQSGSKVDVHVVTEGMHTLAVMVDARRRIPLMVSLSQAGKPVMVLRYDAYAANGAFRPQLFDAPKGLKIEEVRPPPAPPPTPNAPGAP